MKKNTSRLIVFCAVIMGFMLVSYDSSFAHTQSLNLEAAHFVPAAGMPINDDRDTEGTSVIDVAVSI